MQPDTTPEVAPQLAVPRFPCAVSRSRGTRPDLSHRLSEQAPDRTRVLLGP